MVHFGNVCQGRSDGLYRRKVLLEVELLNELVHATDYLLVAELCVRRDVLEALIGFCLDHL